MEILLSRKLKVWQKKKNGISQQIIIWEQEEKVAGKERREWQKEKNGT